MVVNLADLPWRLMKADGWLTLAEFDKLVNGEEPNS